MISMFLRSAGEYLAMSAIPAAAWAFFRSRQANRTHVLLEVVIILYLGTLAGLTLAPLVPETSRILELKPFTPIFDPISTRTTAVQIVGNLLWFVPAGILLSLRWPERWNSFLHAVIMAGTLSLTIEVVQYVSGRGRVASINDLILNTLGGVLGWIALYVVQRQRAESHPATS